MDGETQKLIKDSARRMAQDEGRIGTVAALHLGYTYTAADIRRRPRNVIIGLVAVLLLVFFTGVVLVGIFKAPYILLRLAELTVGEVDILLTGGLSSGLINYTNLSARLDSSSVVHGSAPRWLAKAIVSSAATRGTDLSKGRDATISGRKTPLYILLIDSALEKEIGIGRAWPYREIGYGEAHIFYSVADFIGVEANKGQRVQVSVNTSALVTAAGINDTALTITRPTQVTDPMSFYIRAFFIINNISGDTVNVAQISDASFKVNMADGIDSTAGKYSSVLGNVMILDSRYITSLIADESCIFGSQILTPAEGYTFPTYADLLNISEESIANLNVNDYAMMVATVLRNRYDMYYSETDERALLMTRKSNEVMAKVGLGFDGGVEFPIETTMQTFDMFRIMMTAAFITVVIGIVVLGCILVFTLLQINAEERQFELAMIRAQGMPQNCIIVILMLQTLAFTIPGTGIGVALTCAANAVLENLLSSFTKAPARPGNIPGTAMAVSVVLGMLLPLLATYSPVKRALGSSLRDALDIYRQAANETHIKAIRLETMGLAMWQIALGTFLVLAGFTTYYLMPLSFIFANYMMFFILLDIILVCMIAGLCMMSNVIQSYAEAGVLFLLLWGSECRLKVLIQRNLRSHRERNAMAYMMFVLSVACLTSAGIMFGMLSEFTSQIAQLTTGAPITVVSSSFKYPIDQAAMDAFLKAGGAAYAESWAYTSFSLQEYPQVLTNTQLSNLIGESRSINVRAMTETFMDATYSDFNMVEGYNGNYEFPKNRLGKKDVVRSMYRFEPSINSDKRNFSLIVTGLPDTKYLPSIATKSTSVIPMILSSAARDALGLGPASFAALHYKYALSSSTVSTVFYLEVRALMNRISGFIAVSSLPIGFSSGSLFIPTSYFEKLLNPIPLDFEHPSSVNLTSSAVTEVRQATLFVQLHSNVSTRQRQAFVNALQTYTDSTYHTTVDTSSTVEQLRSIQSLIMYFFYFTAIICIILCAFMMWITFISNVHLNSWTFGVLRSIGFRTVQLVRGAIYEALCIVLSAFIFGCLIGVIVGITMASQLSGFMVVPFSFNFPYILVLIVLALALLAAVVGSTLPFIQLHKKSICSVLRGI